VQLGYFAQNQAEYLDGKKNSSQYHDWCGQWNQPL
jgi:hypothetical protein